MATDKQMAANKANAKKSTGPKTEAGKAVVSCNAISHGILSQKLLLDDESPKDYQSLQDDLRQTLKPAGALELALVEKIAIALWKQRRLVAAESAMLELGRNTRMGSVRAEVKEMMGLSYIDSEVTEEDLAPLENKDVESGEWCIEVLSEIQAIPGELITSCDLVKLAEIAPNAWEQLKDEAESESKTPEKYLKGFTGGFPSWLFELKHWCMATCQKLSRKPLVQSIARMVQAQKSAPISNEVLMRYQVSLDGELYRAIEALRKQQEFRLKMGIEIEGELVESP